MRVRNEGQKFQEQQTIKKCRGAKAQPGTNLVRHIFHHTGTLDGALAVYECLIS